MTDTSTQASSPDAAPTIHAPEELTPRDLQRAALRDLSTLATECATTESEIERRRVTAVDEEARRMQRTLVDLDQRYHGMQQAVKEKYNERLARLEALCETEVATIKSADRAARQRLAQDKNTVESRVKEQVEQAVWLAESVFEGAESQVIVETKTAEELFAAQNEELDGLEHELTVALAGYGWRNPPVDDLPATDDAIPEKAGDFYQTKLEQAKQQLRHFSQLAIAHMVVGATPVMFVILMILLAAGTAQLIKQSLQPQWEAIGITEGIALAITIAVGVWANSTARKAIKANYIPVTRSIVTTRKAAQALLEQTKHEIHARYEEAERICKAEIQEAKQKYAPVLTKAVKNYETGAGAAMDESTRKAAKLQAHLEKGRAEMDSWLKRHTQEVKDKREKELIAKHEENKAIVATLEKQYGEGREGLAKRLADGLKLIQSPVDGQSNEHAPLAWDDPRWATWLPPKTFPTGIRFGELEVDLKKIADSVPRSGPVQLALPPIFNMPASLGFPRQASLLIQCEREGRPQALRVLQNVMTRLLTGLPAGRVRFTIIDPVGLGQNFAGFMRLADFDEALVGGRIWTESDQIEQRLADLTEHMETVIQKYLRNEYENIDEYNAQAGELAEPYRFLVIADFPVSFGGESFRRLNSIAASGARCGVYTLVMRDIRQHLSSEAAIDDIEHHSVNLVQEGDKFIWKDPVFEKFPLRLDTPPSEEFLTKTLDIVGKYAKEAKRVEVKFDTIAPKIEQIFSASSEVDMGVPIGRMGATKLQYFRVGKGMAQHTLIAGKTGSGKSTLLHAVITNLAMWYSPDEVELYLIDFKKGVEFKTYAVHGLPHARAIAVESDREFGLSVLQRLDAELTRRGDIFRKLGVQDLAAFRGFKNQPVIPRTLLVIDEFQEFFSEDDKVNAEAGTLLDRLVRQGRAFGIHVLLGSQTLGGAGGLPRTTMGQMAVRIALQCSEADSQLILGDNNSAARLLTRPGEAIYNDQGGLVEANSPFQIAWLPDEQREIYLKRVEERMKGRKIHFPPAIVFEGNAPADFTKNEPLKALLQSPTWPKANTPPVAWIGDPVAIKDPTGISFRRQSGANAMLIGQYDDAAMGIMSAAMVSIAAQHAPGTAIFYVLDGTPADSPLAGTFDRVRAILPHEVKMIEYRAAGDAINELAEEVKRRQETEQPGAPSIYAFIIGLQRYRMLRKAEDDFSFSMSSGDDEPKKANPGKQFPEILKEGPVQGVHVVAWTDTPISVERTLDRTAMREFDHRILFQMSANDSSNLIDNPAANKLGANRALAYSEELGTMEKFRPYAVPSNEFLAEIAAAFAAKPKAAAATA